MDSVVRLSAADFAAGLRAGFLAVFAARPFVFFVALFRREVLGVTETFDVWGWE